MKELRKVASLVGKIVGLIMGDNFTTPASDVTEKHTGSYPRLF